MSVSSTSLGPRRPLRYLVALAIVSFLFIHWSSLFHSASPFLTSVNAVLPTNSTLGFGAIYVLSKDDSPRRERLIQAANVTEIDLTIPVQPHWTLDDEENFRLPVNSTVGRGSLLAWLGHLHILREFLKSGAETAIILEDDVDWDIRLRSLQVPLVSSAVRSLLPPAKYPSYPYGHPKDWDLLYMGHCGDYFHGMDVGFEDGHVVPENLTQTPHIAFHDPSLPELEELHPWTESLLENFNLTDHTRLVHRSRFPLCTFAYGVTRASAHRLLTELAGSESPRPGAHAYDVTILRACISDGLRCWSVNPELFHHTPGASMIAGIEGHMNIPPVDEAGWEQVLYRDETSNIDCGFWNEAFIFEEGDHKKLEWLREEVARKGKCLKEGRGLLNGRIVEESQETFEE
ncbi:glycosyltransferase family 25 protein [Aplosporella prunicola CBS 121167]|uniref:Glycosyltransferase family 25 protein n=1 Tax=Aplosporella prunicola CBS 121167 TaxID=1176127 RepID=A0A6A6BLC6_9PEZI|nr:glycosyltransferase family 25 protein [Aplosporella prunicola CBS 121167]KAF2144064.1 glycosyltransferase family 25 protein [Aplosporella prunicola CBS 121167]